MTGIIGFKTGLKDKLPDIRGQYRENFEIASTTWFRVGGPCEVLFKPADIEDLQSFLRQKPKDIACISVGVASNLLVRGGGIPGVTTRLGKGFNHIALHNGFLDVGAAVLDRSVATLCVDEGIQGLEFFCGIPGTIGGALRMNAGCYGTEVKDVLVAAYALDPKGQLQTLTPEDMGFTYRHCAIPQDWVFIGARFKAPSGDAKIVGEKIAQMLAQREETQPIKSRTGGSTFANPEGQKAWELIDQAGCRGLTIGGAQMSEKHCNFMINTGDATAQNLEDLGEEVRRRVLENSGIELRWEIQRVGLKSDEIALRVAA